MLKVDLYAIRLRDIYGTDTIPTWTHIDLFFFGVILDEQRLGTGSVLVGAGGAPFAALGTECSEVVGRELNALTLVNTYTPWTRVGPNYIALAKEEISRGSAQLKKPFGSTSSVRLGYCKASKRQVNRMKSMNSVKIVIP